ncbi:MAG TPA: hypothetical protein VF042_12995 [Gemmatimonadaceae bacterium]
MRANARGYLFRISVALLAVMFSNGCGDSPTGPKMRPQSIVLLVTPKILPDFDHPEAAIASFFEHYKSLTSHASETVVIFAVGNSDHILGYRGREYWDDRIEWARTTNFVPISEATLDYGQLQRIIVAFRTAAARAKITLKIFDHIDSGGEFTVSNDFKYVAHPECTANAWGMYDIRARLRADQRRFATRPDGIAEGTTCGEFLADQTAAYLKDVGFDGILFDNQLGTRGRWHDGDGPGYSIEEAEAIQSFLDYTHGVFAGKQLMWFDSYNNIQVERDTFSFPSTGYQNFDYLIASGFCVTIRTLPYTDNLTSKLSIQGGPRILATLDYVDPWYNYRSMHDYWWCTDGLEQTAVDYRSEIDGIMFFANDSQGALVPKDRIDSFADRFWN